MKLQNPFANLLRPQRITYLELHGYNGCQYRLTSPRKTQSFSVEITRPGTKGSSVLTGFTKDFTDAEAFTRYLVETGARPEQLPHAAAVYFS